jgi:hypothetical protein
MGVYIPPCSNVESSVNICICNVATVCATEVLAVSNANMTALMACLRSICRRNGSDLNAIHLALVFKERTELVEVPRVTSPAESLVAFLGVHTPSDILQVLNGNAFVFFLCFRYDLFAYAVIDNSGKSSLTSFQPFQQLMTVARAFGLDRSSHFVVSVSYVLTSSEETLVPSDKETMSVIPISTPRKSSADSSSSSGISIVWYR